MVWGGGRGRYGWGEMMVWGRGKEGMGWGRGVELRILIQKPGVRGITPPPLLQKSQLVPAAVLRHLLSAGRNTLTFFSSL